MVDKKTIHFEVYKDKKSEWRWRLVASNGKIIADSAEGYHNRKDCVDGMNLVNPSIPYIILGEAG